MGRHKAYPYGNLYFSPNFSGFELVGFFEGWDEYLRIFCGGLFLEFLFEDFLLGGFSVYEEDGGGGSGFVGEVEEGCLISVSGEGVVNADFGVCGDFFFEDFYG